jgi:hypothetical protein
MIAAPAMVGIATATPVIMKLGNASSLMILYIIKKINPIGEVHLIMNEIEITNVNTTVLLETYSLMSKK